MVWRRRSALTETLKNEDVAMLRVLLHDSSTLPLSGEPRLAGTLARLGNSFCCWGWEPMP